LKTAGDRPRVVVDATHVASQGVAMTDAMARERADQPPSPISRMIAEHSVELVRWPADRQRRDELAAAGRPRLLLVEHDAIPPQALDHLEDWIRIPARQDDIAARRRVLCRRSITATPIHLDSDGLLRRGGAWVALSPVELRLFRQLYAAQGAVVDRARLSRALRPSPAAAGDRPLDTVMVRVRRRVRPLGALIHTVPRVGFLLELASLPEDVL
jgi:hypothetical protein